MSISSLVVERWLLHELGGFDDSPALQFREDYDFCLRLALRAPAAVVPETVCYVRDHPGRATNARSDLYERSADVYRKFFLLTTDPTHRQVCRECGAYHLIESANARRAGATVDGLRALGRALRFDAPRLRWWRVLLKAALCPLLRAVGIQVAGCGSAT